MAVSRSLALAGFVVVAAARVVSPELVGLRGTGAGDGGGIIPVECDVESDSDLVTAIRAIPAGSTLKAIVHCAGKYSAAPLGMMTRAAAMDQFALHTASAAELTALGARRMREGGSIVYIGSAIAEQGLAGHAAYSMSKAALNGLVRVASRELGGRGIRVNAIIPGVIDTPFLESISVERKRELQGQTALGRLGTPDDVASLARFLTSSESDYITGQCIPVDGGLRL